LQEETPADAAAAAGERRSDVYMGVWFCCIGYCAHAIHLICNVCAHCCVPAQRTEVCHAAGVDVFGRGSFAGGGLASGDAVRAAQTAGMPVVIHRVS
jgi:hypothetical protein